QFFDREVGGHLRADGDDAGELAVRQPVGGEPARFHADHGGEVAAGGVAGEKHLVRIPAARGDVAEGPGGGGGGVVQDDVVVHARGEPVGRRDDGDSLVLKADGPAALAAGEAAAVQPDDGGEARAVFGIIQVQPALRALILVSLSGGLALAVGKVELGRVGNRLGRGGGLRPSSGRYGRERRGKQ